MAIPGAHPPDNTSRRGADAPQVDLSDLHMNFEAILAVASPLACGILLCGALYSVLSLPDIWRAIREAPSTPHAQRRGVHGGTTGAAA